VCKDHDAPFDFVYHSFMGLSKVVLAMANRSGGKTLDFAVLSILDTLANDNCESANLGAIQAQAHRCYRYMQGIINSSPVFRGFTKGDGTIQRREFMNRSSIEVLVATMTGVNSPHPQKLKMDEVELIPWVILQEALSMVQSKGDVKGVTVLGSTRKFATGPMQKLLDQGGGRGVKIFTWCILETMEPFPDNPALPNFDPILAKDIRTIMGTDLPDNTSMFSGYYKWEDFIEKYQTLDRDVLDIQWFCKKPDLAALIYSRFDEGRNVETNFKLDLTQQIYIFEDFGNSKDHPDVILFAQHNPETNVVTVFDELYLANLSSTQMVEEAKKKLTSYGMTTDQLTGWIPDHHMLTQVIDRKNMGLPIWGPVDDTMIDNPSRVYLIANGVHLVRKFIDEGWFKITPNCTQLRAEFMSYSRKRKPNGEYSDDPDKKNDHGPDAVRYGLVRLFPTIALGTFGDETYNRPDKAILRGDPAVEESSYLEEYDEQESDGTYTGGLMGTTF
jgi:hypothetical protein